MPVDQEFSYRLLHAFGRLEFQLKRHGGFFQKRWTREAPRTQYQVVDVDWQLVEAAVRRMDAGFSGLVDERSRTRLLAERETRPMVQEIAFSEQQIPYPKFAPRQLPPNDAVALVVAMRRVRNNLFHGGKEDAEDDPYSEDNDWAEAATVVALTLSGLLNRGELVP